MSRTLSRRKLITTGLATAAGLSGLGVAAVLAERYGLIPPDHGGVFGVGETMTYAAQRILMLCHPLGRIQPQPNLKSCPDQWQSPRNRKLPPTTGRRFPGLAPHCRRPGRTPVFFLSHGTQALSFTYPDNASSV